MEKLQVFNYSLVNSNDNHLDVYIDGDIVDAQTQQIYQDWFGDDTSVSFKSLRDQVNKSNSTEIKFHINSYGGHVGDAMAIHDWIQVLDNDPRYNIATVGMGMICSAATYVLSAAKNSSISKNSWYMIHNVSGGVRGDVSIIENYAKTMRKFNDAIVDFYVNLTGKTAKEVQNWMDAETWFTGTETVENGFVKNLLNSEPAFTNTISPDLFPYKNRMALTMYNSFVKPENDDENFNLNTDMNKLIEGIVNALVAGGFIANKEGDTAKPLTTEGLTNAFTTAFEGFDISNMVETHINEMFKDGLPENIQTALATAIGNTMTEKTKDFATNTAVEELKTELEEVKKDVANKAGGANPKDKGTQDPKNTKFEHDGVTWGQTAE